MPAKSSGEKKLQDQDSRLNRAVSKEWGADSIRKTEKGKVQSLKNLKDRSGNYVIPQEEYFEYLMEVVKYFQKILKRLDLLPEEEDFTEKQKKVLWSRLMKYRDEVRALSEEEALFYIRQQICYMRDYPDLNMSSDLDNLHSLIMEQIFQKKCRKKMASFKRSSSLKSYQEMSKLVKESFARMQKHELNLSFRRRDRQDETPADEGFLGDLARKLSEHMRDKKDDLKEALRQYQKEDKAAAALSAISPSQEGPRKKKS